MSKQKGGKPVDTIAFCPNPLRWLLWFRSKFARELQSDVTITEYELDTVCLKLIEEDNIRDLENLIKFQPQNVNFSFVRCCQFLTIENPSKTQRLVIPAANRSAKLLADRLVQHKRFRRIKFYEMPFDDEWPLSPNYESLLKKKVPLDKVFDYYDFTGCFRTRA